jgi:hypothetical protein
MAIFVFYVMIFYVHEFLGSLYKPRSHKHLLNDKNDYFRFLADVVDL